MFARIVTMPLKPHSTSEFARVTEESVIPLLRKHKGFLDEIAMVTDNGRTGFGISFWDTKENADAYSRSGYGEVMKALDKVVAGRAELKTCQVTNSTYKDAAALVG